VERKRKKVRILFRNEGKNVRRYKEKIKSSIVYESTLLVTVIKLCYLLKSNLII
jgi:hypothetical protein